MTLSAGESFSGGQVRDTQSRSVVISETTDAALSAGEFFSGGFLCDADSRTVICQDTAHSALTANEQYTSGDVRDKAGRLVCAAETVNSVISAGSQFSGGWLRDSRGRRIIALDTRGANLSVGEQFTAGQVRDSVGRLVLALETVAPVGYDAVVLADTPVGFWPLNETVGTTAFDRSTNANNGTYTGAVTLGQPGPCSDGETAPSFPAVATSAYVIIPSSAALNITGALTLEMWINPAAATLANYGFMISKEAAGTPHPYEWRLNQPNAGAATIQAGGAVDTGVATANVWTHMAVTVTAGNVTLFYRNGVQTGSGTAVLGSTAADSVYLGTRGDFFTFWQGLFAKAAIYNVVLTPGQIAAHYAAR